MFYGTYKLMIDRFPTISSSEKSSKESHSWLGFIARRRARRVLLAKSDRLLADLGFSRELLEEGVKAWPWLVAPETTEVVATAAPVLELTEHQPVVAEVKHQVVEEQRHAA